MRTTVNFQDLTNDGSFTVAFESLGNSLDIWRKIIKDNEKKFAYLIMKVYVVCTHRGDSNEYTQYTIMI